MYAGHRVVMLMNYSSSVKVDIIILMRDKAAVAHIHGCRYNTGFKKNYNPWCSPPKQKSQGTALFTKKRKKRSGAHHAVPSAVTVTRCRAPTVTEPHPHVTLRGPKEPPRRHRPRGELPAGGLGAVSQTQPNQPTNNHEPNDYSNSAPTEREGKSGSKTAQ